MPIPDSPKIYHIVHHDRLASIVGEGGLLSDAQMAQRQGRGTVIGMSSIKQRRLEELSLASHPGLYVGECVPFYFCPRSIMLYLLHCGNHQDLTYRGGQQPIIHLEADLRRTVEWAEQHGKRWAFTLSNAGSYYFEDRNNLQHLGEVNWDAVQAQNWSGNKEGKQAEFLIEGGFPWELVERIGVYSQGVATQVIQMMQGLTHKPRVEILRGWYY